MSVLCMMAGAAAELRERRLGTPFTPSSTHYHRILEIEYAIKNNRPFNLSPKKSRRAHSKRDRDRDRERAKSGRGKYKLAPGYEAVEEREEEDEEGSASEKENAREDVNDINVA